MAGYALNAVELQLTNITSYASSSLSAALGALDELGSINLSNHYPTYETIPDIPLFNPNLAPIPSSPNIENAPSLISVTIPDTPVRPDIEEIEVGNLYDISLPDVPSVSFSTLNLEPPVYNIGSPAVWNFSTGDILISDDPTVQEILTRIYNNIHYGGTGLSTEVETAIWNREKEREEQQLEDTTDKTISMWAKKGFSLPDGMLADSLSNIQKDYMNQRLTRAREISIKQAELEQSNLFKSMELGISLTSELIKNMIAYEELVYKNNEATAKYANEYISLQIQTYNSKVELFKSIAQVNESIVRTELSKVELYSKQIEAQKLIADINKDIIDIYKSRIESSMRLIERYKTDLQAMTAELDADRIILENNKIRFDVWAKEAEINLQKYNTESDIYKSSCQVAISESDFQSRQAESQARINISTAELSLKSYETAEKISLQKAQITMEAQKGAALAASSLAAGAMAAMSVHSGLSYSESMSLEEPQ